MAANEDRPLTQWEIEEIKRCEAIVKFSEDVLAGRHPRIKIQPHLRPENQPCPAPIPDNIRIDFQHNYYKDLGIQSDHEVTVTAIENAFLSRWPIWSPVSEEGKRKWIDHNPAVRALAEKGWDQICIAHKILTTPTLKARYDAGRPTKQACTADELIAEASKGVKKAERKVKKNKNKNANKKKKKKANKERENTVETTDLSDDNDSIAGSVEEQDGHGSLPLPRMLANTPLEENAEDNKQLNMTAKSNMTLDPQDAMNPAPKHIPDSELKIDEKINYYKALRVQSTSSTDAIQAGFNCRWQEVSPDSPRGKLRWAHEDIRKRQQVAYDWDMICTAHKILTTPALRGQYDSSRIIMLRDKEKREAQATRDELTMLLAKKRASEKRLAQAKLELEQSAKLTAENVEHAMQEQKRLAILAKKEVELAATNHKELALLIEATEMRMQMAVRGRPKE